MNSRTGVVYDERYFAHAIERHSLENPARLHDIYAHAADLVAQGKLTRITPRMLSTEEVRRVHSSFYMQQLESHAATPEPYSYDKDTYLMERSVETAMLAAGGGTALADAIMEGEVDQGFALIRPPGHHAEPGQGMGFCIFNNVALVARHLLDTYDDLHRILLLDFDVHHGNGTQEAFYHSREVMFVSLHQEGIFPGTGGADELGEGEGEGFTVNIPVHTQFGDSEYTYLIGHMLQTLMEQYMPQFILVSAGYDAHIDDPISATTVTTPWYGTITTMLRRYAMKHCDGRLLYLLEGGYNRETLRVSVEASLAALCAPNPQKVGVMQAPRAQKLLADHPLKRYWTL